MPIFRRVRLLFKRSKYVPFSRFVGVVSGVLTATGAASQSVAITPIATGAVSSAGVGSASFVGAGVISGSMSVSGAGAFTPVTTAFNVASFSMPGSAAVSFGTELRQIISRNMLQDPVDCVLAGQQDGEEGKSKLDPRRGFMSYRALRGIFRE